MKILLHLSLFLFLSVAQIFSQNNCGDSLPVLQCPVNLDVCLDQLVTSGSLSSMSSLPNTEYAIIDYNTIATSGAGPAVVGFDQDGMFVPSTFGLTSGSNFGVIPIAYDLAQIQETLDDVLFGTTVFLGLPTFCCTVFSLAGFDICGELNAAGIFSGSDITDLETASNLFAGSGDDLTIEEFAAALDSFNMNIDNPNLDVNCGGGDEFCYAYGNECVFTIIPDSIQINTTHIVSETISAPKLVSSNSVVQSPFSVDYYANECVELTAGFETMIGATFHAYIDDPCN